MPGEKILIVDDDKGLLMLMKTRLEAAGYLVAQAEGGEDALSAARNHLPCGDPRPQVGRPGRHHSHGETAPHPSSAP